MCHPAQKPAPPLALSEIPQAVVVQNDAYFYLDNSLYALIRTDNGSWKLSISLSMCWGCFGDRSFVSATCWGVLCQCCGGTGWEDGDLEFCPGRELPSELELCVVTDSARTAFMRLLETDLAILNPVKAQSSLDVSRALVRGQTAKLEIIVPDTRYMALLQQDAPGEWCLVAFEELCQICGGRGVNTQDENMPCSGCGGLKWGKAGSLRYCRNDAPGWYVLSD